MDTELKWQILVYRWDRSAPDVFEIYHFDEMHEELNRLFGTNGLKETREIRANPVVRHHNEG